MTWHWILWGPLESFGLSPPYHSADKVIHNSESCDIQKCCHSLALLALVDMATLFSLFFHTQPKGTKLMYRIYKRIVGGRNMLICRQFHRQKNPKTSVDLSVTFLRTLSNKASSNAATFPWVGGIRTISLLSFIFSLYLWVIDTFT